MLSGIVSSLALTSLSDVGDAKINRDQDADEKGRPDFQIRNSKSQGVSVGLSLASGKVEIPVFRGKLAGRAAPSSELPQVVKSNLPEEAQTRLSSGLSEPFTVRARVDGRIKDTRQLGLPIGGMPEEMSVVVRVTERKTEILYSEV